MQRFPARCGNILTYVLMAGFAAALAYLAISGASMDSATDDEPVHIAAGYIKLKTGNLGYYRESPPLMNTMVAWPLRIGGYDFPPAWQHVPNEWDAGHDLLYRGGHDAGTILLLCRIPVIVLYLLLGFLVYRWAFTVTGNRWFSMMGFALAGFCPNLMAHGRLATADVGLTFFIALSVFLFFRFLYAPGWGNIAAAGVSTAFALLSKVSGLILLPYLPVLLLSFMVLEKRTSRDDVVHYASRFALMLAVTVITIEVFYLLLMSGSYIRLHYSDAADSVLGKLAVPLEEYGRNVSSVYRWVSEPYNKPQFLLGSFSFSGWWYYYPVAFFLKTPLPVILLFAGSIAYAGARFTTWRKSVDPGEKRYLVHMTGALLFVLIFLAVACTSRLNLGVRYILPVYPFIFLFVTLSASRFYRALERPGAAHYLPLFVLVAWAILSGAAAHPSQLGYFNGTVRNETDKDRYLIDSNLDWGQDLKRLSAWVEENRIPEIYVAYFGGGEPAHYLGSRALPFPDEKRKGYYAISRTIYRTSSFFKDSLQEDFEGFFRNARLVATIGGSIYVFRID